MSSSITVEAWIKVNAITGAYQDIITRESYGQSGTGGGYELSVTNAGKLRLDLYQSPTTYTPVIGSTTVTTGVWHHVAGVFDGSQTRVYLDGVVDGTLNTTNAPASGTSTLKIGRVSGGSYFGGLIDEARVSNAALYTSNFTPQGQLTASGSTKGLWKFDGQTANDSSGNSNHGTLNGGATYATDVPAVGGGSAQNVIWTNAIGVNASGNNLTKTAAGNIWGNAGASSSQAIVSGDGYVEFTATELSTYRMVGISNSDTNQNYEELDYAFYLANSYLYVYENGVNKYWAGFFSTGDTLRIAIEGGVVKYRKNGAVVYTSSVAPVYPLMFDASLYTAATTLNNALISGNLGTGNNVEWLMTDHLGTPRMIIDLTGALINLKRHDYLPFGEELFAPSGGRTAQLGYAIGDGVRQQFTLKERDTETGLDYFLARYHSSTQGRFTSPDPYNIIFEKEKGRNQGERDRMLLSYISQPQIWNKYAYTINNPLKHTDPDGRRALTKEDEARLKKLTDYAAQIAQEDGNSELVSQVQDAVAAIRAAIAAVPENVHDGLGPNDPAALRAVFWAIDNLGNTNYGVNGTVPSNGATQVLGRGDNKCTLFVANAYALGAQTGFCGGGVPTNTTFFGHTYPTSANDLANPANSVPNFPVTRSPQVGNIAAFPASVGLGHATLNLGGNVVIYASDVKVKVETVKYVEGHVNPSHPTVTYREYKP